MKLAVQPEGHIAVNGIELHNETRERIRDCNTFPWLPQILVFVLVI
jgi:hypothetical protein